MKHILLERPNQNPREGARRRPNLLCSNRFDFNQDLQVFQLQTSTLTTEINSADNTGPPRIFRVSDYFSASLETLVVRNYSEITDSALQEIETYFNSVKYLDVTGSKCTAERVAIFQNRCPEVRLLHSIS